jgi:uncharacterized integral membrane protein
MKKLIIIIWLTAILVIGLVFIQNQGFSLAEQRLSLNLLLFDIALPPLPNGAILLAFFIGGILLSAASSVVGRFKTRKALKRCKATGDGYIDKIGALKNQLDEMKSHNIPQTTFKSSLMNPAAGGDHAPA